MAALTSSEFVALLRIMASVSASEYADSSLSDMVDLSIRKVDPDFSFDNEDVDSGSAEAGLLLLYAMIDLALARMGKASLYYEIEGQFGKTKQQNIVDNQLKLIRILSERIKEIEASLTVGDSEVSVHELIRCNEYGQNIPWSKTPTMTSPVLTGVASSDDAELTWNQSEVPDFAYYTVWRHTSASIVDNFNKTDSSASHYGVVEDASEITKIYTAWNVYYRDETLDPDTYYYVVSVTNLSGRVEFSNEVTVEIS